MHGDNSGSRRLLRKALRVCKETGEFDSVDSIAKELADDYFFDGIDSLDAGDYTEAEGLFRKAIRLFPLHADAWGHLGIIHENRGNLLEAGRCYWHGLQFGRIPCHERELHDRWIARVTRSPKEARTHYWGHMSTRPYLRAIYNWAQLLYQRKDFRGALAYAEESLMANPNDNTGARYLVYSILRVLEKKSQMRKLAREYPGESLSHEADQLEIRCFGSRINKQERRGKPN
jgi:tetratricopeptide (TPR) repeat protein